MLKFLLVGYYMLGMWYFKPINQMYYEIENFEFPSNMVKTFNHEEHVYAIDFDGTICYTKYPTIIKPLPYAIEVLQVLAKDPYSTLILWTCREGEYLQQALNFCELYGIKFDYVNENCKRNLDLYTEDCRKVSADIYIDDHSYQGQEGVEKLWHDWYFWMKENDMIEE